MGLIDLIASSSTSQQAQSLHCVRFLDELLSDCHDSGLQVRLWDGQMWGARSPRCTLVLKHPGTLRRLCTDPTEVKLGEAYIYDDVDIEGDIEAIFGLSRCLLQLGHSGLTHRARLMQRLRELPDEDDGPSCGDAGASLSGALHSKKRDRQAVRYHYDLPREFFSLFLGKSMQYSSAYFRSPDETDLDAAQERKLDYICRKLGLREGENLLDVGCGWGGLLVHAVARYGVRALGITLSVPQAEMARQRIRDAGLNQQCRIEVCDYRDLEGEQLFDKIVSVGMIEHVGEKMLSEYFESLRDRLKTGGRFLVSGIAVNPREQQREVSFTDRYVFPDGDLVPISTSLGAAERAGFEVRDLESLREHYGLTLRQWVRRLEEHAREARNLTDETTYRIWRLYMAGSASQFFSGRLNLYHTLLVKGLSGDGIPLVREDWYRT